MPKGVAVYMRGWLNRVVVIVGLGGLSFSELENGVEEAYMLRMMLIICSGCYI